MYTTMNFSQFIQHVAGQAGIPVNLLDPSLATVTCELPQGRRQTVYIQPLGVDPDNNLVVGFFSPALKLAPNQMLGQKMANELLRNNSKLLHSAWAILTLSDGDYLAACDTQIVQHMQPQELKASTLAVALQADAKEQELTGSDIFR